MAALEPRTGLAEGTRLDEQIAIEVPVEGAEQIVERGNFFGRQDIRKRGERSLRGFFNVAIRDDAAVFQVRDEHRLHQQGL